MRTASAFTLSIVAKGTPLLLGRGAARGADARRRLAPLTAEMAEEWNYDDLSRVGQPVIKWDEKSREYRWRAGEGAVSVPAAGNTWVAPHHEDLPTPSRRGYRFIFLPATCTVHFE